MSCNHYVVNRLAAAAFLIIILLAQVGVAQQPVDEASQVGKASTEEKVADEQQKETTGEEKKTGVKACKKAGRQNQAHVAGRLG